MADQPARQPAQAGGSLDDLIKSHIRDVPDFPEPGISFKDITPLLADGPAFAAVIDALAAGHGAIDKVAGIEARGFILAAPVACVLGSGFVPIRKQGKLPPPVVDVAYELEYGSGVLEMQRGHGRLMLIDDVLATGGTMTAAADLCQRAGYELRALAVLIDLKIVPRYSCASLPLRAAIEY